VINKPTPRGSILLALVAMASSSVLGCANDEEDPSTATSAASETSSTSGSDSDAGDESSGANVAMEVDCSDAPTDSIPVCLARTDDGDCADPPDELLLCRGTCIDTCCFEVEEIACGPDIAQTDRCCYWILVGEMSCAETPEQTCLAE
jgi:hypothetical protein